MPSPIQTLLSFHALGWRLSPKTVIGEFVFNTLSAGSSPSARSLVNPSFEPATFTYNSRITSSEEAHVLQESVLRTPLPWIQIPSFPPLLSVFPFPFTTLLPHLPLPTSPISLHLLYFFLHLRSVRLIRI